MIEKGSSFLDKRRYHNQQHYHFLRLRGGESHHYNHNNNENLLDLDKTPPNNVLSSSDAFEEETRRIRETVEAEVNADLEDLQKRIREKKRRRAERRQKLQAEEEELRRKQAEEEERKEAARRKAAEEEELELARKEAARIAKEEEKKKEAARIAAEEEEKTKAEASRIEAERLAAEEEKERERQRIASLAAELVRERELAEEQNKQETFNDSTRKNLSSKRVYSRQYIDEEDEDVCSDDDYSSVESSNDWEDEMDDEAAPEFHEQFAKRRISCSTPPNFEEASQQPFSSSLVEEERLMEWKNLVLTQSALLSFAITLITSCVISLLSIYLTKTALKEVLISSIVKK